MPPPCFINLRVTAVVNAEDRKGDMIMENQIIDLKIPDINKSVRKAFFITY